MSSSAASCRVSKSACATASKSCRVWAPEFDIIDLEAKKDFQSIKVSRIMAQIVTIELPETLYRQLQRTAELAHQPLETIVVQSLAHSLPPLLEDIPAEYQPDVYPLLK